MPTVDKDFLDAWREPDLGGTNQPIPLVGEFTIEPGLIDNPGEPFYDCTEADFADDFIRSLKYGAVMIFLLMIAAGMLAWVETLCQ